MPALASQRASSNAARLASLFGKEAQNSQAGPVTTSVIDAVALASTNLAKSKTAGMLVSEPQEAVKSPSTTSARSGKSRSDSGIAMLDAEPATATAVPPSRPVLPTLTLNTGVPNPSLISQNVDSAAKLELEPTINRRNSTHKQSDSTSTVGSDDSQNSLSLMSENASSITVSKPIASMVSIRSPVRSKAQVSEYMSPTIANSNRIRDTTSTETKSPVQKNLQTPALDHLMVHRNNFDMPAGSGRLSPRPYSPALHSVSPGGHNARSPIARTPKGSQAMDLDSLMNDIMALEVEQKASSRQGKAHGRPKVVASDTILQSGSSKSDKVGTSSFDSAPLLQKTTFVRGGSDQSKNGRGTPSTPQSAVPTFSPGQEQLGAKIYTSGSSLYNDRIMVTKAGSMDSSTPATALPRLDTNTLNLEDEVDAEAEESIIRIYHRRSEQIQEERDRMDAERRRFLAEQVEFARAARRMAEEEAQRQLFLRDVEEERSKEMKAEAEVTRLEAAEKSQREAESLKEAEEARARQEMICIREDEEKRRKLEDQRRLEDEERMEEQQRLVAEEAARVVAREATEVEERKRLMEEEEQAEQEILRQLEQLNAENDRIETEKRRKVEKRKADEIHEREIRRIKEEERKRLEEKEMSRKKAESEEKRIVNGKAAQEASRPSNIAFDDLDDFILGNRKMEGSSWENKEDLMSPKSIVRQDHGNKQYDESNNRLAVSKSAHEEVSDCGSVYEDETFEEQDYRGNADEIAFRSSEVFEVEIMLEYDDTNITEQHRFASSQVTEADWYEEEKRVRQLHEKQKQETMKRLDDENKVRIAEEQEQAERRWFEEQEEAQRIELKELKRRAQEEEEAEIERLEREKEDWARLSREAAQRRAQQEEDDELALFGRGNAQRQRLQAGKTSRRSNAQLEDNLRLQEADKMQLRHEEEIAGRAALAGAGRQRNENDQTRRLPPLPPQASNNYPNDNDDSDNDTPQTKEAQMAKAAEKIRLAFAAMAEERAQIASSPTTIAMSPSRTRAQDPQSPRRMASVSGSSAGYETETAALARYNTVGSRPVVPEKSTPPIVSRAKTVGPARGAVGLPMGGPRRGLPSGPKGGILPKPRPMRREYMDMI